MRNFGPTDMFSNPNPFDSDDLGAALVTKDPIALVVTDMVDSSAVKQTSLLAERHPPDRLVADIREAGSGLGDLMRRGVRSRQAR